MEKELKKIIEIDNTAYIHYNDKTHSKRLYFKGGYVAKHHKEYFVFLTHGIKLHFYKFGDVLKTLKELNDE